jgi:hypothetical protein
MTKEQFIRKIPQQIVYEFYKEKAKEPLIREEEFYNLCQLMNFKKMYEKANDYYVQKFNIVILMDKDGKFIKYL